MLSVSMIVPLVAFALTAPQQSGSEVGVWKTETNGGVVEIQRCGASLCGRVATSAQLRRQPGLKDARNANAALRNRFLKGLLMLSGFVAEGSAWSRGTICNAEDGKTYQAKLTPVGGGRAGSAGMRVRAILQDADVAAGGLAVTPQTVSAG